MAQVETVAGPIDAGQLGTTLMHEHVFVLNEEIRRNFPGDWDERERIDDAAAKLTALARRGCDTIADPTVLGLGRDIARVQQVAARASLRTADTDYLAEPARGTSIIPQGCGSRAIQNLAG